MFLEHGDCDLDVLELLFVIQFHAVGEVAVGVDYDLGFCRDVGNKQVAYLVFQGF